MFEVEKKLFKGSYGVNFDVLNKSRLGSGSGGKKNLFESVCFSGFNNIEDAFDWLKTTVEGQFASKKESFNIFFTKLFSEN